MTELPAPLQDLPEAQQARLTSWQRARLQPGFATDSARTWEGSHFRQRWQRTTQPIVLERTASKLGGEPYLEDASDWPKVDGKWTQYCGQIRFRDLRPHLSPLPTDGLLVFYHDQGYWRGRPPLVTRWYPNPREGAACSLPTNSPPVTRLFESRLTFESTDWGPLVDEGEVRDLMGWGADDEELVEAATQWVEDYGRRPEQAMHEVLPPELTALKEAVGPGSLVGRTVLFRLEHDGEAGFAWGTNSFYLHIANSDLASGDLDRVQSSVANA